MAKEEKKKVLATITIPVIRKVGGREVKEKVSVQRMMTKKELSKLILW